MSARPALVRTARQVAVTLARRAGLDDEALEEVRLAVGEACGLAVAVAALRPDATVRVRYTDDDGLAVKVDAAADLRRADGEAAADVVTAAVGAVGDERGDGALPAGSTLMVLTSVVPRVAVRTGPEGLAVRLAWPA
jgi:hypothetical protein